MSTCEVTEGAGGGMHVGEVRHHIRRPGNGREPLASSSKHLVQPHRDGHSSALVGSVHAPTISTRMAGREPGVVFAQLMSSKKLMESGEKTSAWIPQESNAAQNPSSNFPPLW